MGQTKGISIFQTLKPRCIAASEAALAFQSGKLPPKQLIARLHDLAAALESLTRDGNANSLNAQLAEYAFFPLSHVFRQRQNVPPNALELALRSLQTLLSTGWRKDITPDLGTQLMIMLTFVACDKDGNLRSSKVNDDLLAVNFACLAADVHSLTSSQAGRRALTATTNIPALGHAITGVLNAVSKAEAASVGQQALHSLHAFAAGLDRDVLSSFLPGMISTLTKVLTPSTATRRPFSLLAQGLDLVSELLGQTLADTIAFADEDSSTKTVASVFVPQLDRNWLATTAGQIKQALANMIKLRQHDRSEVIAALQRLCITVLRDCQGNLSGSVPLMLDTLIATAQVDGTKGAVPLLRTALLENPTYVEKVRDGLYNRLLSMPRLLASNDLSAKENLVQHLITAITLLDDASDGFGFPSDHFVFALRQCIDSCSLQQHQDNVTISHLDQTHTDAIGTVSAHGRGIPIFPNIISSTKADDNHVKLILAIVSSVAATKDATHVVQACLNQLQTSSREETAADFWLALQILRFRASTLDSFDEFVDSDMLKTDEYQQREELYLFALSVLADSDVQAAGTGLNWYMCALALETVAFQACNLRATFRLELSDALYPVLQHLGSPKPQLQRHTMVALDSIAASTSYPSARAMIIDNNDYLINEIGLKLSTFDLSPQAPRVLQMLVQLCGAKLLPFLDDLTDSIFDALELYHGYDSLAGLLFQCLGSIVEQGIQTPALTVHAERAKGNLLEKTNPTPMDGLALLLRQRERPTSSTMDTEPSQCLHVTSSPEATPRRSWKAVGEGQDLRSEPNSLEEGESEPLSLPEENNVPSLSQSYKLIHRITVLTQHHLPSGNTLIRSHLLHVLNTALPYLALYEDSFLPLIHTLWPVLVPRLQDSSVGVVSGVLNVMARMAEGSGGFVRGRIMDIWDDIRRIHRRAMEKFPGAESIHPDSVKESKVRYRILNDSGPGSKDDKTDQSNDSLFLVPKPSSGTATLDLHASRSAASRSSTSLAPDRERPASDPAEYDSSNPVYLSASSLTLHRALTAFLVSVVTHVDLAAWVFDDILGAMLLPYITAARGQAKWIDEGSREAVLTALEDRNTDAVWLTKLRHGQLKREGQGLQLSRPAYVEGAAAFAATIDVR